MRCARAGCRGRINSPEDSVTLSCSEDCRLVLHKDCFSLMKDTSSLNCITSGCGGILNVNKVVLKTLKPKTQTTRKFDVSAGNTTTTTKGVSCNKTFSSGKTVLIMRADSLSLSKPFQSQESNLDFVVTENNTGNLECKKYQEGFSAFRGKNSSLLVQSQRNYKPFKTFNDGTLQKIDNWPPLPTSAISFQLVSGATVQKKENEDVMTFDTHVLVDPCLSLWNTEEAPLTSDILSDDLGWSPKLVSSTWPLDKFRSFKESSMSKNKTRNWFLESPFADFENKIRSTDTNPEVGDCMMELVTAMFGYPTADTLYRPALYWDTSRGPPPPPIPPPRLNLCPVCGAKGCQTHPLILSTLSEAALRKRLNPTAKPWEPPTS